MAKITGIKYTRAELCDILGTALHAAISYWATVESVERTEDNAAPKRVVLRPSGHEGWGLFDFDDNRALALTLNDIQNGIDKILSGDVKVSSEIVTRITTDVGDIDGEAADVIVQAALFREIVYA